MELTLMTILVICAAIAGYVYGAQKYAQKHNEYLRKHLTDLEQ